MTESTPSEDKVSPEQEPESLEELSFALSELAKMVKPMAGEVKIGIDALYYLLLLWGFFQIYPLEPSQESDSSGGATVIPVDNGWDIYDYGDCLSTSPGEHYRSYCTGKMINSTQEMIEILVKRGVTKVGFLGHEIARRAAWIECVEHEIEIINYDPTDFDQAIRQRILERRKLSAKARQKLQAGTQRHEPE